MRIQGADLLVKFFWNGVGQTTPFFEKIVFFEENFNLQYLSQLISCWYQIETSKTKEVISVERFFYLFLILKIRLATKSKVRNLIFLRKRVCFQNFGRVLYYWIQLLNFHTEKKYKKNKNWKMNFWPIFILFYFLFFYFFLNFFFIFEKFEKVIPDSKGP